MAVCTILTVPAVVSASEEKSSEQTDCFNNTVFVGDSISRKLELYVESERDDNPAYFGNAVFLTAGGLGSGNAQLPVSGATLHPSYAGQKMLLEDSVAVSGAKKMYIMFGMNDLVPYGIEGAIENYEELLDKILANSPSLEVVVQSVTPIMTDKQQVILNNENIEAYNDELRAMCSRRGFEFLDVGPQLQDSDGGLLPEYCGDAHGLAMHLSDAACRVWIDYLLENLGEDSGGNEAGNEFEGEENGELLGETGEELSHDEMLPDETAPTLDDFGQELESIRSVDVEEMQSKPQQEVTQTGANWYEGLDTQTFLKEYAKNASDTSTVPKKWKPKLKGRVLNPPA